jgi:hypothetical protein
MGREFAKSASEGLDSHGYWTLHYAITYRSFVSMCLQHSTVDSSRGGGVGAVAPYAGRSDRTLREQREYNLGCRWCARSKTDWNCDVTVLSKTCERRWWLKWPKGLCLC